MEKQRLDILLVDKNLAPSRERAKSLIMAGLVFVDGQRTDKAGSLVPVTANIHITGDNLKYVSRGGLKLEKAVKEFNISLSGKVMMDVGASTGGFTDCALQNGAKKVFAIDVGYGQLAWSLRNDKRVVNMERTNIRYVTTEQLGQTVDLATIDVAFISLEKVLPVVKKLLIPGGEIIALIKPQFEAGREKVGKKGVVKDRIVHIEVITKIYNLAKKLGLAPLNLTYSPVKGPEGNIEYLIYLINGTAEVFLDEKCILGVVDAAHSELN